MSVPPDLTVVLAGGHSAGHLAPLLSTADALRRLRPDVRITVLGTERGLDTTLVPARGYPLELIPPVPLRRRPDRSWLTLPARVAGAVHAARAVLDRTRADVVVGFGGYVALPAYLAARRRRTPIVLHEANAQPGVANRVGARLTPHVYTAEETVGLPHARVIGIPLSPAIAGLDRRAHRDAARRGFGLDTDTPTLVVTGGSQGARAVNAAVAAARPALRTAGVQVLHIVGPNNADTVLHDTVLHDTVPDNGPGDGACRYVTVPYVEQMQDAYAAADLMICRAGAMTCAEVSAVGLPAVFVPLPLRGGEQRRNAEPIVSAGGGLLVEDAALHADWIARVVVPLLGDAARLDVMGQAAARLGHRDAAGTLAAAVLAAAGAPPEGGAAGGPSS